VEKLLKSIYIFQIIAKIKVAPFFETHCIICHLTLVIALADHILAYNG